MGCLAYALAEKLLIDSMPFELVLARDTSTAGDTINVKSLYHTAATTAFAENWCGTDPVSRSERILFMIWVLIYILGFHDYGTAIHAHGLTVSIAMKHMKEVLSLFSGPNQDLRPLRVTKDIATGNPVITLDYEMCLFFTSFLFLKINNDVFKEDTDTMLNDAKDDRLSGTDAHAKIRNMLVRARVTSGKLLPTVEALDRHRMRAEICLQLWANSMFTALAEKPQHIGRGYRMIKLKPTDAAEQLAMELTPYMFYLIGPDGAPILHIVKTAASVLLSAGPRLLGPAGGDEVEADDDDGGGGGARRAARPRPRPKRVDPAKWEDLTVTQLKMALDYHALALLRNQDADERAKASLCIATGNRKKLLARCNDLLSPFFIYWPLSEEELSASPVQESGVLGRLRSVSSGLSSGLTWLGEVVRSVAGINEQGGEGDTSPPLSIGSAQSGGDDASPPVSTSSEHSRPRAGSVMWIDEVEDKERAAESSPARSSDTQGRRKRAKSDTQTGSSFFGLFR